MSAHEGVAILLQALTCVAWNNGKCSSQFESNMRCYSDSSIYSIALTVCNCSTLMKSNNIEDVKSADSHV